MSLTTLIASALATLIPGTTDPEDVPLNGADSVKRAVSELENLRTRSFDATLGEPTLYPNGGEFFTDPKVVVPLENVPFNAVNSLVFDLPAGTDDDFNEFMSLLNHIGLEFDELELVEGETVPMTFVGGNAVVDWKEAFDGDDSDSTDEGAVPTSEELPDEVVTEEDVEARLDEIEEQQEADEELEFDEKKSTEESEDDTGNDDVPEGGSSDDSVATIEEQTISSDTAPSSEGNDE